MEKVKIIDELEHEYTVDVPPSVYVILIALHEPPYSRLELRRANRKDAKHAEREAKQYRLDRE